MEFKIPHSWQAEHEELHAELVKATQAGGKTGDAAKAVAELLHAHFVAEEEYALPPLGLLPKLDPWDSRYYYPATPLTKCPRAWTIEPEYGVEVAEMPPGSKLLAFVARPIAGDAWPIEPDRLNPEATQVFLQLTHERYAAVLGDRFGKQVQAIFTDEPKYACGRPWTRDMFSAFKAQFGYDLPPRLWMLFSQTTDAEAMLTRLHFRQWCGERFREAWLAPVGRWCREHRLALVGHISPETIRSSRTTASRTCFPCTPSLRCRGWT